MVREWFYFYGIPPTFTLPKLVNTSTPTKIKNRPALLRRWGRGWPNKQASKPAAELASTHYSECNNQLAQEELIPEGSRWRDADFLPKDNLLDLNPPHLMTAGHRRINREQAVGTPYYRLIKRKPTPGGQFSLGRVPFICWKAWAKSKGCKTISCFLMVIQNQYRRGGS
ncbi:hypothetical protein CEXT_669671 [Caerostris extrusa]|uniref:Uncharacterized protein n=1 Tax=Caerostris extrusa TaxID=172846 RepID=A0AAV4T706_CAEEX|nr:hypothetical protein CEXT_669671 [Caerostris extrusa]